MVNMVTVKTYNRDTQDLEDTREVDHDNRADRVWMGKHCFWAFRNNRLIVSYPSSESEPESMEL